MYIKIPTRHTHSRCPFLYQFSSAPSFCTVLIPFLSLVHIPTSIIPSNSISSPVHRSVPRLCTCWCVLVCWIPFFHHFDCFPFIPVCFSNPLLFCVSWFPSSSSPLFWSPPHFLLQSLFLLYSLLYFFPLCRSFPLSLILEHSLLYSLSLSLLPSSTTTTATPAASAAPLPVSRPARKNSHLPSSISLLSSWR